MSPNVDARPGGAALPRVVLLDMDDTIFDHALTSRAALGRLRPESAALRAIPLEALWREYSRLLEAIHPEVLAGHWNADAARAERFRQLAAVGGTTISLEEGADLSRRYRRFYQELRRPVPGALRFLRGLHGRTTVGVVTNNQTAEQEEKLDFLGIRSWVDFMVVSEGAGVAKPEPRIFQIALETARARPENAVMVGDSWENDVLGARGAGIGAVWFNRFHRARPSAADGVLELRSLSPPREAERTIARAVLAATP